MVTSEIRTAIFPRHSIKLFPEIADSFPKGTTIKTDLHDKDLVKIILTIAIYFSCLSDHCVTPSSIFTVFQAWMSLADVKETQNTLSY